MHQIKLFTSFHVADIEKEVNTWLEKQEDLFIISINTTTGTPYTGMSSSCMYIITIVYEE